MNEELIQKINIIVRKGDHDNIIKLINTLTAYGNLYTMHFKRNVYRINNVGKHTETGELFVNYRRIDDLFIHFNRPFDMFMSEVDKIKYPHVEQTYRMEILSYNPNPSMCGGSKLEELTELVEKIHTLLEG